MTSRWRTSRAKGASPAHPVKKFRATVPRAMARPTAVHWTAAMSRIGALVAIGALAWSAVHMYQFATTNVWFNVKHIDVRGHERLSREEILRWTGLHVGSNIFRMPLGATEERLRRKGCFVKVGVARRLPNTVLVHVKEREPLVSIGGVQLDVEGMVSPRMGVTRPGGLPIPLAGTSGPLEVGRVAEASEVQVGLAVAAAVKAQQDLLVQKIIVEDVMNPRLVLMNGIEVKLGSQRFEEKLSRIHDVLTAVESRRRLPTVIDLRYREEAAVTFK